MTKAEDTVKRPESHSRGISDYFYTLGNAAIVLGVTRICIWKWIQQGKIQGEKIGRETIFPKWEIELLKKRRESGKERVKPTRK